MQGVYWESFDGAYVPLGTPFLGLGAFHMDSAPENRARTVAMCRRLGIWPLDARHRAGTCLCPDCFGEHSTVFERPTAQSPDELAHLRAMRRRVALPWEEDAA